MALSNSVNDSLEEAAGALRNALAYAARQERPITCNSISKLLLDLEHVKDFDEVMDSLDRVSDELS